MIPDTKFSLMTSIKMTGLGLFLFIFHFQASAHRPLVYDVRKFGAKGDGRNNDTPAIQRAIDKCAAGGGGVVFFPPGSYRSTTLFLEDNITMEIPGGSTLLGDTDIRAYPVITPGIDYYDGRNIHFSLFYAEGKRNITICGNGLIDGRGAAFSGHSPFFPSNFNTRPFIFWFVRDSSVHIKDIHLRNSGYWMQHYLVCEDILIEGIRVFNHSNKNNDMMDIDGCRNIRILHCIGDSDDDGITLKSMNEYPVENVVISDCVVSSHCNAIKCGTESSGGFKNIVITNCIIKPSSVSDRTIFGNPAGNSGITLTAVDGGDLDGVVIGNIRISGPLVPIFLRLGNRARPYKAGQTDIPVSRFRNVMISHVLADGASKIGCLIAGLPGHELENVQLSDISITFAGGRTVGESKAPFPENENKYPDAEQFGTTNAYGFHIRHARNITLRNITMHYQARDDRPALVLEDVDNGTVDGVNATLSPTSEGYIKTIHCGKLRILNCMPLVSGSPEVFLRNLDSDLSDILLTGTDLRGFSKAFEGKGRIHQSGNIEQ